MRKHRCANDEWSERGTWWVYDAQGIPLCRVCPKCKGEKLARYRREILTGYDHLDVDEPVEADAAV